MSGIYDKRDELTAEERRAFLLEKNFRVAARSFPSRDRELWTVTEIGGRYHGDDRQFFLDLVSGAWQQKGRCWELWSYGPWFLPAMPWLDRCRQLGFVIGTAPKQGSIPATFDGRKYGLHESTQTIWDDSQAAYSFGTFSESLKRSAEQPVVSPAAPRVAEVWTAPAIAPAPMNAVKKTQMSLF